VSLKKGEVGLITLWFPYYNANLKGYRRAAILHELTHIALVPKTEDFGYADLDDKFKHKGPGFYFDNDQKPATLSKEQLLNNADTYASWFYTQYHPQWEMDPAYKWD
jgi:hypothetical protein